METVIVTIAIIVTPIIYMVVNFKKESVKKFGN